jgi:hypothetical protein
MGETCQSLENLAESVKGRKIKIKVEKKRYGARGRKNDKR